MILITKIKEKMLKNLINMCNLSSPYKFDNIDFFEKYKLFLQQDSDPDNIWAEYSSAILKEVMRSPETFLREEVTSRTLHPYQLDIARAYLQEMQQESFCQKNILSRLSDPSFGCPYLCPFFPYASPVSMQHAYYLWLLKKYINVFLPDNEVDEIIEFGGGYGNFYRISRSFGYKGGYHIIDIPVIHALQYYYLMHSSGKSYCDNVNLITLQNDKLQHLDDNKKSIFIATFSLNESSMNTRNMIKKCIDRFKYLFIAYNLKFDGIDNVKYFSLLEKELGQTFDIINVQDGYRHARFLFGLKR